jgi:CO dehydrogenase maturation factor
MVVMDMEAGIEHLGRGTARGVDKLLIVVEPGRRSIDTALHIRSLAAEIGLDKLAVIGNKVRGQRDRDFLRRHLGEFEMLGFLPYETALVDADLGGVSPFDVDTTARAAVLDVASRLSA